MQKGKTALPVLVAIVVFGIAASQSLFVEGEPTGTPVPGLHPTTETAVAALNDFRVDANVAGVNDEAGRSAKTQTTTYSATAAPVVSAPAPDGAPPGYVYWKTVRAKVTAYEPGRRSCGKYANGKTSIGQNAWIMDGVAADPRAIPYGT